jgi:hypothetical protein
VSELGRETQSGPLAPLTLAGGPLRRGALSLDLRHVGANLQLEFGGRKKEGGKGEKLR